MDAQRLEERTGVERAKDTIGDESLQVLYAEGDRISGL